MGFSEIFPRKRWAGLLGLKPFGLELLVTDKTLFVVFRDQTRLRSTPMARKSRQARPGAPRSPPAAGAHAALPVPLLSSLGVSAAPRLATRAM